MIRTPICVGRGGISPNNGMYQLTEMRAGVRRVPPGDRWDSGWAGCGSSWHCSWLYLFVQ